VSALERGHRRRPQLETIRSLAAALDLEPEDRDELARLARGSAAPDATIQSELAGVPVPPTPLVGREKDMAVPRAWMADPAVRLVTVTGPGGSGKTRLALQVARDVERLHAARVRFVPLADVRTRAFAASAIAEALGLTDVSPDDLARRARVACSEAPVLL